jgi:hypothetical protein
MAKKKSKQPAEKKPAMELVDIQVGRGNSAIITWKDSQGVQQQDIVDAAETRRKLRGIGSRPGMKDKAAIWKFWLECFGELGKSQPGEEPLDRERKPSPRARGVDELTP